MSQCVAYSTKRLFSALNFIFCVLLCVTIVLIMAVMKKGKYGRNRRLFGQAVGRNSQKNKRKQSALFRHMNEKYKTGVDKHVSPYQIVTITNNCGTKLVVRRIRCNSAGSSRLLKSGKNKLKFRIYKYKKELTGNRVINLDCLQEHISSITAHVCLCPKAIIIATKNESPMTLKYEKCKSGLFSILMAICAGCNKEFKLETSKRQDNGLFDVNVRAV